MTSKNENNSLRQYVDFYDSHLADIEQGAPAILNQRRHAARAFLEGKRLPDRHTEGFERTSVNDMFASDFGLNIRRIDMPADLKATFRCGVPNLTTIMGVTVNDVFHPTSGLEARLPDGVFFGSLSRACREIPEVITRYFGSVAAVNDKSAAATSVALNDMLVQDGTVIYVPDDVKLDRSLQMVNLLTASAPLMAVRRVLIVLGHDAQLSLLSCDHTVDPSIDFAVSQVSEIVLCPGARLDFCDMEESSSRTVRHSLTFVRQLEGSELSLNVVTLQGGSTRNDFDIAIEGEHCSTHVRGMAVGCDDQHIDNCSNVRHRVGRSSSRQLFKYVLDDTSTGAFEGSIVVADGAAYTEAYQSNRNVLASPDARMHTRPQLEIYNDDVKCSHGASTGQLDTAALFYMRTRGIPQATARTMLMQAFMADVIDAITIPGLRERLHHLVERRFHRHEAHCSECVSGVSTSNDSCHDTTSDLTL